MSGRESSETEAERHGTHLVDISVGAGANLLDELVLVLGVAPRDVRAEKIGVVVAVGAGHLVRLSSVSLSASVRGSPPSS